MLSERLFDLSRVCASGARLVEPGGVSWLTTLVLTTPSPCVLGCAGCPTSLYPGRAVLGREHLLNAVAAARSMGVCRAVIRGGDPIASPSLQSEIAPLRAAGIDVEVQTPGVLLGPSALSRLRDLGVRGVRVVLDGTPQRNDGIRGPCAIHSIRGAERALAAGLEVSLVVAAADLEPDEAADAVSVALSFPVDRVIASTLGCRPDTRPAPDPLRAQRMLWRMAERIGMAPQAAPPVFVGGPGLHVQMLLDAVA